MDLRRDQLKRIARAPAKLNLYLEVLGRRADGFHELETLMVPVRLCDTLGVSRLPAGKDGQPGEIDFALRFSGSPQDPQSIPSGKENLVVLALELFRERSGSQWGARVELVKRIPAAAGLGGGSSDAAAALGLANRVWDINWPGERLSEIGAELGSDVPFFVAGGAAVCRGRGERVEPLHHARPYHFVIVKPPADLSTADVYRVHAASADTSRQPEPDGLQRVIGNGSSVARQHPRLWMRNRLQAAAASLSPWVDRLRSAFESLDFVHHQLSGSGSAYFGVCRHAQHARRLAAILRRRQLGLVYATRSCA
jgi:4-diphosphocytidyl-2-C-methyl-D-erythritol kinase